MNDPDAGWVCLDVPGGVHLLPIDDSMVHSESRACPCAPKVSLVHDSSRDIHTHVDYRDGQSVIPSCNVVYVQYVRNLIVHSAMDGRKC